MALIGKFRASKGKKTKAYNPLAAFCNVCCTKQRLEKNEFTNMQILLWLTILYFWIGSYVYHWTPLGSRSEKFIPDTAYFLVVTMTTVGFGDMTCEPTPEARLFTVLWILFGVGVVALLLVEIGSLVVDARDAFAAKARASMLKASAPKKTRLPRNVDDEEEGDYDEEEEEEEDDTEALKAIEARANAKPSRNPIVRLFQLFPILEVVAYMAVYAVLTGWLFTILEAEYEWTFIDGVYYAVIMGTSVGYGDIYPQTELGKGLAIIYIPIAVVFVSTQLSEVGPKLFGASGADTLANLLKVDLSLEALLDMVSDGDGSTSEFEFLRFFLVQGGFVDKDVLDSLHDRFAAMDEDGSGALTPSDLREQPLGLKAVVSADAVQLCQNAWQLETSAFMVEQNTMRRVTSATKSLIASPSPRRQREASETPADNNAATGGAQQGEQIEKQASSGATSEFATPEKPAKEEGFLDGAFGGASDALNEAFSFAASPLDKFNDLAEVSSGGMDTFTQAMPRLSDMAMSFDDFDLMGIPDIPTMPDMLTMPEVPSMFAMFGGKDLNAVSTEEAADVIWERMRTYMKERGNARATELFTEMDIDRSGKIDANEFMAALDRMGIQGVTKEVAKAVIKTVDPNGDGELEYKEILPMLKTPRKQAVPSPSKAPTPAPPMKEKDIGDGIDYNAMTTNEAADAIWEKMRTYMKEKGGQRATDLFKEMDKDRSGKIDVTEFIAALERMGIMGVKTKVAKAVIKTVDPNGDGQLEYKEILPMLKVPRKQAVSTPVEAAASAPPMKEKDIGDGIDYNVMTTNEAADAIWEKMRAYMKEKGGQRATDLFKEMDKDRSGKIDVTEFIAALERMGIMGVKKKVAKAVIKTVDPNGDGQLEYKEILPMLKVPRKQAVSTPVEAAASAPPMKEKDIGDGIDYNVMTTNEAADAIWEKMRTYMKEKGGQRATDLFKEMDKDRSGKIDVTEFIAALERMGIMGVKKKVAKAVIKTVDPNGDGQLEYKEILPMLKAPRGRS